jgi:hypothetical protein
VWHARWQSRAHAPASRPASARASRERLWEALGPDRDAAAREYAVIRRRLEEFFDRRGVPRPESLAEEALDRLALELDEGADVLRVRASCYPVARNVLQEWQGRPASAPSRANPALSHQAPRDSVRRAGERAACLQRCLDELSEESRRLVVSCYAQPALADPALKARARRVLAALEERLRRRLRHGG